MILLTFNVLRSEYYNNSQNDSEIIKVIESEVQAILGLLEIYNVRCTFFCEAALLPNLSKTIKKLVQKGHELSIYNLHSNVEDLAKYKEDCERLTEKNIKGLRQADFRIPASELKLLEFSYISNLEYSDVYLPFKKLSSEVRITEVNGISHLPECVSPYSHFPYNDLLFQLTPQFLYQNMIVESLKNDDFVLLYLNTYQFSNRKFFKNLPFFRKVNTGKKLEDKLSVFLEWINEKEIATARIKDFVF